MGLKAVEKYLEKGRVIGCVNEWDGSLRYLRREMEGEEHRGTRKGGESEAKRAK